MTFFQVGPGEDSKCPALLWVYERVVSVWEPAKASSRGVSEGWSPPAGRNCLRMWWWKTTSARAMGFTTSQKGWRKNCKTQILVSGRLVSETAVAVCEAVLVVPMQTVPLRKKKAGNGKERFPSFWNKVSKLSGPWGHCQPWLSLLSPLWLPHPAHSPGPPAAGPVSRSPQPCPTPGQRFTG